MHANGNLHKGHHYTYTPCLYANKCWWIWTPNQWHARSARVSHLTSLSFSFHICKWRTGYLPSLQSKHSPGRWGKLRSSLLYCHVGYFHRAAPTNWGSTNRDLVPEAGPPGPGWQGRSLPWAVGMTWCLWTFRGLPGLQKHDPSSWLIAAWHSPSARVCRPNAPFITTAVTQG